MGHSPKVKAGIAINLDKNILGAALPLLQESIVETIEWSFDALYQHRNIPAWFVELLETYAEANALIGHGVFFSLFNANWTEKQTQWLEHLSKVHSHFHFDHITEHFGYMTGQDFHRGAPMPVPLNSTTLLLGQQRLQMIGDRVQCPIGLENLAFAFSKDDVKRHGDFLEKLVSKCNGFLILDLHNLYCQAFNFNIDPDKLLELYPLHLVKEIHISGGSWEDSSLSQDRIIRRDTHDNSVPQIVFELLQESLGKCDSLTHIILEQIGVGLISNKSKLQFKEDFIKMKNLVSKTEPNRHPPANRNRFSYTPHQTDKPSDNGIEDLKRQQGELSKLLESSISVPSLIDSLNTSSLARSDWSIENWDESMIETAYRIVQKWK